ncbi:MAG: LCP family protein [Peptostreptococcaceae bacterium]|nr:LCP family protein [Peptostreptococcaceae bacterium]
MKTFFKVFAVAFLCFTTLIGSGTFAFIKYYDPTSSAEVEENTEESIYSNNTETDVDAETPLEKAVKASRRVNVLLLGLEGYRTDTIMLASFDPDNGKLDIVSIPRDTYYYRSGYDDADQKKINAAYGHGGAQQVMAAVSDILNVPVHEYVKVTYSGIERIVDSIGGVEVNVPIKMDYDDIYAEPELHIHFEEGVQTLRGDNAIEYLRFRKNNDGAGYQNGDLGRIEAQQEFLKSAAKNILSFKLPVVANTMFQYIKTDMSLPDILYYAKSAVGMTRNDINTYRISGRVANMGLSYFLHDPADTEELMTSIYTQE